MSHSGITSITLNNGKVCPIVGLGTWTSPHNETVRAVKDAIDIGYRHIDCAYFYGNEKSVGIAINDKIQNGIIKREDIFITSKLWNTFHHPDIVLNHLTKALRNFNISYFDLYLMHFPCGYREGNELIPYDDGGNMIFSDVDYLKTWIEMEKAVDQGLVKSIGVSNFNRKQIDRLLAHCRIKPVMNQIECHPYLTQLKLSEYCTSKGIAITAYSPLGAPFRPWAQSDGEPILMDDNIIKELAQNYNKTVAQILIRYQMQRGHIVIPKSVTHSRLLENFDVFNFELSDSDMEQISNLDSNIRYVTWNNAKFHRHYPFHDEY